MTYKGRIAKILSKAIDANNHLGLGVWRRLDLAESANRANTADAPVLVRNLSEKSVEAILDEYPESALFDNGEGYGTTDNPRFLAHGRRWLLFAGLDDVVDVIRAVPAMRDDAIEMALGELGSDHEGRIAFTERSVNRSIDAMVRRLRRAVREHGWLSGEPDAESE
mgnify:CR=1 FL=1